PNRFANPCTASTRCAARAPRSGMQRQRDPEGRTLARPALDRERPAVPLDVLAGDVEPEAEPAVIAHVRRALEAVEDPRLGPRRYARAFVGDGELGPISARRDGNADGLPRRVLDRISQQVL